MLHLVAAFVPEPGLVGLLKRDGGGLLQRRHTAVTDTGVGTRDILDQVLRANQVADPPSGGVESLTGGADCQGALVQLWRQSPDSGERDIEESVVYLV